MTGENFLCGALKTTNLETKVRIAQQGRVECCLVRRPSPSTYRCIDVECFCTPKQIPPLDVGVGRPFRIAQICSSLCEYTALFSYGVEDCNIGRRGSRIRLLGLVDENGDWFVVDAYALQSDMVIREFDGSTDRISLVFRRSWTLRELARFVCMAGHGCWTVTGRPPLEGSHVLCFQRLER
jgi:hypothetical protein